MTTDTLHPLAAEYLQRLQRAGRDLPPGRLRELLTEIEGHLSEAIDPTASDAQALEVLDKLGEPEAIIAAETQQPDEPAERRRTTEWTAIFLLLFGGFIFGVGWLAGLILLWSSRVWTARDKWLGTLVIPGGLATSVLIGLIALIDTGSKKLCQGFAGGAEHCTPSGERAPARAFSRSRSSRLSCWRRSRPRSISPAAQPEPRHGKIERRAAGTARGTINTSSPAVRRQPTACGVNCAERRHFHRVRAWVVNVR